MTIESSIYSSSMFYAYVHNSFRKITRTFFFITKPPLVQVTMAFVYILHDRSLICATLCYSVTTLCDPVHISMQFTIKVYYRAQFEHPGKHKPCYYIRPNDIVLLSV